MPGRIERKWRPTLSLVFLMTPETAEAEADQAPA